MYKNNLCTLVASGAFSRGYLRFARFSTLILSLMLAFFLLHLDKLHVEDESCEGRDGLSCAALAVAESVRNEEAILGTLLHELQTFGPSCDHAVQGELGGARL